MPFSRPLRPLPRRTVLASLAGFSAVTLAAPHVARAAVRTARFGHNNADTSQFGQGGTMLIQAVAADPVLNGVIKIEVYGNAQLGDDVSMLKSCQQGTLDGMLVATSILANAIPEIGIINAPYLFRGVDQARAVLDGPQGDEFVRLAAAKDLHALAWGENGLRHITSNRPIRTVADLQGLKIRVPQSAMFMGGFKALGASPAPLAFGLVREALRSGEFEAQENPVAVVEAAKLYDVQKYLCLSGHIYDGIGVLASADLIDDLTEPQRLALRACARKAGLVTREAAASAARDGVGRLKAAGMTVIDDVDVTGFKAASHPFLESLAATYGESRVRALLNATA